jgi:hypothetical protein
MSELEFNVAAEEGLQHLLLLLDEDAVLPLTQGYLKRY